MSRSLKPDTATWFSICVRQASTEFVIKLTCPYCDHHLFSVEQSPRYGMVLRCYLCRQRSRISSSLLVQLEQVSE